MGSSVLSHSTWMRGSPAVQRCLGSSPSLTWVLLPQSSGCCLQAWHLSSGHPLGCLGTFQLPSRPSRGACSNPTFSQESFADLGTPAEAHLAVLHVGLTLPCPVTCSCPSGTHSPTVHPGTPRSQGSFSRGYEGWSGHPPLFVALHLWCPCVSCSVAAAPWHFLRYCSAPARLNWCQWHVL